MDEIETKALEGLHGLIKAAFNSYGLKLYGRIAIDSRGVVFQWTDKEYEWAMALSHEFILRPKAPLPTYIVDSVMPDIRKYVMEKARIKRART